MMSNTEKNKGLQKIHIEINTGYEADQSSISEHRYVFFYQINIHNEGPSDIQLLRRHWIITDGNGHIREVEGEGVVGKQPIIACQEIYSYTSGVILETEVGSMQGYYTMVLPDGELFQACIPIFTLARPSAIH